MSNLEIADLLRVMAACYQLKNENKNKFKIIAYSRAADAVEHLSSEVKDLWDEGKLDDIPGIGKAIAGHLDEIYKTGTSRHFISLMKDIPPAVFELMKLPHVGSKTAFKLVKSLALEKSHDPLSDLKKLALQGKIALIEGFGQESQRDILQSISEISKRTTRYLLPYATKIAGEIVNWMKQDETNVIVDSLGSLRRMASTIGDIDIAVSTQNPQRAIERFTSYKKAIRIVEKGLKTASILLPGEVQVDLMTAKPNSYGALLQHFTGSKHHNIALREYALKKGLSLSEYGIKAIKNRNQKIMNFKTENDFYGHLGLEYIPPELREDTGEIEAALNHLPKLVELKDIKGDLHIHSNFNTETSHDLGLSSVEAVIRQADSLGYEYLAFSDHNPSKSEHTSTQVNDILQKRKNYIEELFYSYKNQFKTRVKKVFICLEVDILPSGDLSIDDTALHYLDFIIVSIHSSFRQKKNEATKRVISALSNPKALILGHPTGRKLNEREGVELDFPKIFDFCRTKNIFLEINADPLRLDLPDFLVREAIKAHVKLVVGTDSHHIDSMTNMRWGISVAKRGWAKKDDIINSLNLVDLDKLLTERR